MNQTDSKTDQVQKTKIHTRNITCVGYQRDDGLWDIEATLTDTKSQSFFNHERGEIQAGEPIHKMTVIVTLDLDMVIRDIQISMPWTPFKICPNASTSMNKVIGLQIKSGWMSEVRKLVPRNQSCTHVVELLGPISTTAYQTMHFALEQREKSKASRNTPPILNQCQSLASDSAVVKVLWPEFYTGE